MQFLKVLGLLTLLVTGNLEYAFATYEKISHEELVTGESQYVEVNQDPGASMLTGSYNSLIFNHTQCSVVVNFDLRSSYTAVLANTYIFYSAQILPALDVQEIIFPFHTFL